LTIFDLHIIRRTALGFLLLVGGLIVFFIMLHYAEYVDDFMDRGASMQDVFLVYYLSYIPEIVRLTSPLAIFLSCIYVTGRLAQTLQIMTLQMSGVSLYRLMRPYVILSIVLTSLLFWFNGWIVPRSNQTVLEFEQNYLKDAPLQADVTDINRQNSPGHILSIGYYDRTDEVAHRISLQAFQDEDKLTSRLDASKMEWVDSLQVWRIQNAVERTFTPDGHEQRRQIASIDTTLNILPRDLARMERDVESMTVPVAQEYIESLERSGTANLGRTLVTYYSKFSYPLANLIVVLIAVPLASKRRRGGQTVQIGVGLLVAFAYLAIIKLLEPFGYAGTLSPMLAAWLPHILFAGVAVLVLLGARK
jgi:lipopolysaccharide export system permease protein